ncbi:MAG: hypothetical protein KAG61_08120 [Bacteriovoracaceae bacterium]|nr:hypothetical protein [Bacteriovoracaceae bacterium]
MKKILLILVLAVLVMANATAATVMDSLFSKGMRGLDSLLTKHSLDGVNGTKIKSSILASLEGLSKADGPRLSQEQLSQLLNVKFNSDREAIRLKALLVKNVDELNSREIGEIVNGLTYLASSKGASKAKLLTCDLCAGDALSAIGVKVIARTPELGTTAAKLVKAIPSNDRTLSRLLKKKFRTLKLGDFVSQSAGKLQKKNKRSLAIFLGYLEKGTIEEKNLARSIVDFSKDSAGSPRLLENNKLWSIFDYIPEKSMGEDKRKHFVTQFGSLLDEIASEKPIDGSRNANLKNFLERRVKEEPSLKKYLNEFKTRSLPCWGI